MSKNSLTIDARGDEWWAKKKKEVPGNFPFTVEELREWCEIFAYRAMMQTLDSLTQAAKLGNLSIDDLVAAERVRLALEGKINEPPQKDNS